MGKWASSRRRKSASITTLPSKAVLQHLLVVFLACSSLTTANSSSSNSLVTARNLASGNDPSSASRPATSASNTSTIILTETELYDGTSWQAVSWTDASTGDSSLSPSDYPDPSIGSWISDWKIVTGPTRDDFGWEYKTNRKRKRTWIRTYEISADVAALASQSKNRRPSKGSSLTSSATRQPTLSPAAKLGQAVRDSYNFKGFGLTFYKSLVFQKSFGLALRVPLTYNFNLWEEHPSLPNVGASIAIYHPWVIGLFVSASFRMEVLQYAITTTVATVIYAACWLVWTLLLRGLIVAGAAILFPVTRRLYQPAFPLTKPNWHGPDYSRSAEERLGISWSWRFSQARGYEFRVGYWHYFAHSLVGLLKARNVQWIPSWMVRRVAAVGTSISGPILDQPFITANSLLSLSGIHFATQNRGNKQQSTRKEESVTAALQQPISAILQEEETLSDDESTDIAAKSLSMAKLMSSPKTKAKVSR